MSRGRVAVFLPSLAGGGAERAIMRIASGIAEHHDVDLVLGRAEGALLDEVPEGLHVVDLGARRTATAVVPLIRYLRRRRPDALLAALTHANAVAIVAGIAARTGTPVVVSERTHLSVAQQRSPRTRDRLVLRALRPLYRRASAVTAVSQGAADDVEHALGLPTGTVVVIANPVPVDTIAKEAAGPLDHPWMAGDRPVVVSAGRLTAAKDFATLLRAFAMARGEVDLRLVILGEGEDRPMLEQLAVELGIGADVDMPGFATNPYPWLGRSAVCVLSSRWEGLPNVLLEAMALDVPVVATDCDSGPREILDGGRLGALVPVGDVDAIAAAMVAAVRAPRPSTAREIRERYDPDVIAARYLEVLGLRGRDQSGTGGSR